MTVVGLERSGFRTLTANGYAASGHESEVSIQLAGHGADRLSSFYERFIAAPVAETEEERYEWRQDGRYDCHGFADYIKGWRRTPVPVTLETLGAGALRQLALGMDTDQFESGKVYGAICNSATVHSMLGLDDPGQTLSAFGMNSPLIVTSTANVLLEYKAEGFCSVRMRRFEGWAEPADMALAALEQSYADQRNAVA